MKNWFRRKSDSDPIILDCYTDSEEIFTFAKPNNGKHFIPEWFKKTPRVDDKGITTIKKCPAVVDYYRKGIIIPCWGEIDLTLFAIQDTEDFKFVSVSERFGFSGTHTQEQFPAFAGRTGYNAKFTAPWKLRCNEPIQFSYSQPFWSNRDLLVDLHLMPAVMDFQSQHGIELNYFFEKTSRRKDFNIQPLTPLAILHPLSPRPVEVRHHLITPESWRAQFQLGWGIFDTTKSNWLSEKKKFVKKWQEIENNS